MSESIGKAVALLLLAVALFGWWRNAYLIADAPCVKARAVRISLAILVPLGCVGGYIDAIDSALCSVSAQDALRIDFQKEAVQP